LESFAGWLFENPDPGLVEYTSHPGSPDFDWLQAEISEYAENGWRDLPDGRVEVLVAELVAGEPESGAVQLRVASSYDGATTVDADGNLVQTSDGREPQVFTWLLRGSVEEGWRVAETSLVGPYTGEGSDT
jgi:hypothetical protein